MTSRWKEAVYRKYSVRRLRQELEEFKEARRFAPNQRIRAWFDAHIEFSRTPLGYSRVRPSLPRRPSVIKCCR